MSTGNHQILRMFVVLCTFVLIGCKKDNDQLLVTIDGKDTITVNQFKILLENKYGKNASKLTFVEKRKYLEVVVQEHLKLAYATEKQDANDVAFDPESEKRTMLLNKAYERYILGHFLSANFIKKYRRHFGKTVRLQNLVVLYKSENTPAVKISKIQAKKKVDSIYAILDIKKFSSIAENLSDYKNPGTGKGNVMVEGMKFGNLPYNIEKEILAMRPNTISRPVDIQWAFVIFCLFSTEDSTRVQKSDIEIIDHLKTKLMGDDYSDVLLFQNIFLDSLFKSEGTTISDVNIRSMLNKLQDSLEIHSASSRFSPEELDRSLVQFASGRITIGDYLGKYPPGVKLKLTLETVIQNLPDLAKRELLMGLSISDGFSESDEFKSAITSARDQARLRRADEIIADEASKDSRMTPLTFYSKNRNVYRTDGSIVLSEIYSASKDVIEICIQMIESGASFEKVPEMINKDNKKNVSVELNTKVSLNFKSKGELASKAQRLNKNEISNIIARKDGGFSIIKITEKNEPTYLDYDKVTMRVLNDFAENQTKNFEKALFFELKSRWKVVIFENNLGGI